MSNQVATQQNFQQRMMERIRGSIGELMTDEELKKIIEKAVDQIFFKQIEVKVNNWNTKTEPPFIHGLLKELLEEQMKVQVIAYLKTHSNEVNILIEKIVQEGMGKALLKALDSSFKESLNQLQHTILNEVNNQG